jgi:hypothetical protein
MQLPKRRWLILAGLVLVLLGLGYYRRDLGTAYVASQFRSATDAASELEAAERIRNWINWTRGFRVIAKDAQGSVIPPQLAKNNDTVDVLEITWEKGTHVERKILNRETIQVIYRE